MSSTASTSAWTARRPRGGGAPAPRAAAGHRARWLAAGLLALVLLVAVNWIYQVVRKPTELFAPVSPMLAKTPAETWRAYGSLFEAQSTEIVTPELLAALAQAEGRGNPLVRTYWRWKLSLHPFEIYRPASSAVGMFQITDAAFADARKYCIRQHRVVADGPWYDPHSCWFNSFYSRVVPGHAVELTAVYLQRSVADILARRRVVRAAPDRRQELAALVHLCGPERGEAFVKRGFRLAAGERCGDHDARRYLDRIQRLTRQFAALRNA
jgi:hypothetical protein